MANMVNDSPWIWIDGWSCGEDGRQKEEVENQKLSKTKTRIYMRLSQTLLFFPGWTLSQGYELWVFWKANSEHTGNCPVGFQFLCGGNTVSSTLHRYPPNEQSQMSKPIGIFLTKSQKSSAHEASRCGQTPVIQPISWDAICESMCFRWRLPENSSLMMNAQGNNRKRTHKVCEYLSEALKIFKRKNKDLNVHVGNSQCCCFSHCLPWFCLIAYRLTLRWCFRVN